MQGKGLFLKPHITSFGGLYCAVLACLLLSAAPLRAQGIFPEQAPGSFDIIYQTDTTPATVKLVLTSTLPGFPILAPLDSRHKPPCRRLLQEVSTALGLPQEHFKAHCRLTSTPALHITLRLAQTENGHWHLDQAAWQNGWQILSATISSTEWLDRKRVQQLLGAQARLLEHSARLARQYPGLGTSTASLPVAAWQWLTGSPATLFNGAIAIWHGYEVVSHTLSTLLHLRQQHWGHAGLGLLSLIFHTLEGLEHADQTALGHLAHLDFHGDIVAASPYPHGTNISLAGTALLLNLLDLHLDHTHHNHHLQGYNHLIMGTFELLHTGLHIQELLAALSDWWYGQQSHGSHDHHNH